MSARKRQQNLSAFFHPKKQRCNDVLPDKVSGVQLHSAEPASTSVATASTSNALQERDIGIPHDSDLSTNFFTEKSNTEKESGWTIIEDDKVGSQNSSSNNEFINIVAKQWNACDDMNSEKTSNESTFIKERSPEFEYSIRNSDMSKSKKLSRNHKENYENYFADNSNEFLTPDENGSANFNILSHAGERTKRSSSPLHTSITDKSVELLEFGVVDNKSESFTQTPQMPEHHNKLRESSISIQHGFDWLITESLPYEHEVDGRIYMTRIVTEPNPGLKHQTEADMLKQLFDFGIKPLKRKQAVKMLEHIYNSTHPLMLSTCLIYHEFDTNIPQPTNAIPSSSNNLQLVDFSGTEMLRFTKELRTYLENEEYFFQTNVTKKTLRPLLPLHIAWFNIVSSNRALHEEILMYEPVDLHEIYDLLKKIGSRFEPKDIKVFLDTRSIIFRCDMTQTGRQSERCIRKTKKKSKLKQMI